MTLSAVIMMVVYVGVVGGGLAAGAVVMATHPDESAGTLPVEES